MGTPLSRLPAPLLPAMSLVLLAGLPALSAGDPSPAPSPMANEAQRTEAPHIEALEKELSALHGERDRARIGRGLRQAAALWRERDGGAADFAELARRHFVPRGPGLDQVFGRLEAALEAIDGHLNEVAREVRRPIDLDLGPILPIDELLAEYNPSAHVIEDLFRKRVGFVVLLNFPASTLEERLRDGPKWTRRQWAEARLAQRFSKRVPPEVNLMLYLPDYPIGHLIAFQVEETFRRGKSLGEEFERIATLGRLSPELWMVLATGSPISAEPLLRAAEKALGEMGE